MVRCSWMEPGTLLVFGHANRPMGAKEFAPPFEAVCLGPVGVACPGLVGAVCHALLRVVCQLLFVNL